MVFKVLYYSGPFMLILIIVLVASTNCYYVLFSHATTAEDPLFSYEDSFHDTLFKTFQMLLLGENAGSDVPGQPAILVKMLFVFLTLGVNVFMLNLMINLMDDFMAKINGEEGDAFPCEKAGIIADLELMMPEEMFQNKTLFPNWLQVLSPKSTDHSGETDEWKGTVQAVRQENANLERRTRATLSELGKKINDDMIVMEKRFEAHFASINEKVSQRLDSVTEAVTKMRADVIAIGKSIVVTASVTPGSPLTQSRSNSYRFTRNPESRKTPLGHGLSSMSRSLSIDEDPSKKTTLNDGTSPLKHIASDAPLNLSVPALSSPIPLSPARSQTLLRVPSNAESSERDLVRQQEMMKQQELMSQQIKTLLEQQQLILTQLSQLQPRKIRVSQGRRLEKIPPLLDDENDASTEPSVDDISPSQPGYDMHRRYQMHDDMPSPLIISNLELIDPVKEVANTAQASGAYPKASIPTIVETSSSPIPPSLKTLND